MGHRKRASDMPTAHIDYRRITEGTDNWWITDGISEGKKIPDDGDETGLLS